MLKLPLSSHQVREDSLPFEPLDPPRRCTSPMSTPTVSVGSYLQLALPPTATIAAVGDTHEAGVAGSGPGMCRFSWPVPSISQADLTDSHTVHWVLNNVSHVQYESLHKEMYTQYVTVHHAIVNCSLWLPLSLTIKNFKENEKHQRCLRPLQCPQKNTIYENNKNKYTVTMAFLLNRQGGGIGL